MIVDAMHLVVLIVAILFSKRGGATLQADGPTEETARAVAVGN